MRDVRQLESLNFELFHRIYRLENASCKACSAQAVCRANPEVDFPRELCHDRTTLQPQAAGDVATASDPDRAQCVGARGAAEPATAAPSEGNAVGGGRLNLPQFSGCFTV
jgi:hypothetical protein